MPTTIVDTIPGNGYSKAIVVELDPADACKVCGEYPVYGLWPTCFTCWQPICYHCAIQWADGILCPSCAPGR
jgi:hypothetical protein